jgi:predicted PurR-regulated permease PerM
MREHPAPSLQVTHTTLSVFCIAILASAAFLVLRPFLTPMLWAAIISVTMWPLVLRLDRAFGGRRGFTVTVVTVTILLVMFVPFTLALATIVNNARNITAQIKLIQSIELPPVPAWLARVPVLGRRLVAPWETFGSLGPDERYEMLSPYLQSGLRWVAAEAGSLGGMLVQFLVTTVITAILLGNGETVRNGILRFAARLAGHQGEESATLAARAVRSVVLGVVVTAVIQTLIGGAGLLLAGVPAAALLAAVMLFLCLAQLGPLLVLAPAVIWVYSSGRTGTGTLLLVISLVAATIDNAIRPLLIRRGANLPLVLIFAGVIGGLIAFGVIGLFIGPVVLAVTFTLLKAWVQAPDAVGRREMPEFTS